MSVQQEPLKMSQPTVSDKKDAHGHVNEPPKLEFANSSESLEAFGAALGGAILGVLATLLILAIINNGTLRFSSTGVAALDAKVTRIDENLGAVNHNVEVVAQRLEAMEVEGGSIFDLRSSLTSLDTSLATLDEELISQGVQLEELNQTRQNFEAFTAALAAALSDMETAAPAETTAAPVQAEAVVEEVAPVMESSNQPTVVTDAGVPAEAVQAYLFVDSNSDGVKDAEEASLVGATVVLTSEAGETISAVTTDAGALFEGLQPGIYTLSVEDALGFDLLGGDSAEVVVVEGEEGAAVYFSVAGE